MSTENPGATPSAPHALLEAPATREQARPMLETLRAERLAGRVTEAEFFKRSDYLGRLDAGEQVEAPKLYLTPEEQFQSQYDAHMQAPKPEHYGQLPRVPGVSEDAATEIDTAVREAFHRGGVPAHLAGPILEGVLRGYGALANAPTRDRTFALETTASRLRAMWGDEFKARKERVDALVADMVDADDQLAALFDRAPWLFHADVAAMEFLGRVADHKAKGKP